MTRQELAAGAALAAMAGVYLLITASGRRRSATAASGASPRGSARERARAWMVQAGIADTRPGEFAAAMALLVCVGGAGAFVLFGGVIPAAVAAAACAGIPLSMYRSRRRNRLAAARDAWPRMLEELRVLIGSIGRSVPQALFEVGRRGPPEWRSAFAAAEREWLLTTDFGRTVAILKHGLADPTADVVCETLAVAHELGGSDVDARLADLIEDRILDLQGRKDAASRQAGVRFARRFVLLVPLGMALAGLTIGTGRSAYSSFGGQVAVGAGLIAVAACWVWAGRLMRLPEEPRVFR